MRAKEMTNSSTDVSLVKTENSFTRHYRVLVIFFLWCLASAPVFPELVRDYFSNPDNSHGLLVVFIAGYMAWQRKDQIRDAQKYPSNLGLILLVLSLALYVFGLAGGILVIQRYMMVFSFIGLVLYLFGKEIVKIMIFPLFFLLFMVPLPVSIVGLVAFPLQIMATKSSEMILHGLGIPVFREGNMLYFLQTQLEVADACSGIRSIMSMIMLSCLLGYFSKGGWLRKAILVFSAIPIAMLANILRVSGTGILAHFYGGKVARGFLHEFSGLTVFVFGLSLLFMEFRALEKQGFKRSPKVGMTDDLQ
jgi:exosortase